MLANVENRKENELWNLMNNIFKNRKLIEILYESSLYGITTPPPAEKKKIDRRSIKREIKNNNNNNNS